MAGKPKRRIDYAGWSVDIFSNDIKIDQLLDAQGWVGFGIYFYLCQMAFGSDGYFYEWGYALCASTARKMGGGVGAGTVKETVDYCLQIGLFDKGLFDRWGVLTSKGIQNSYLVVLKSKNRKGTELIQDYWLLDTSKKDDYQGVVFVRKNSVEMEEDVDLLGVNDYSLGENVHSLRQKESKGNKSKEDIIVAASGKPKATTPFFEGGSFEIQCVDILIKSCLETFPNSKVPVDLKEKQKWAVEIERMKRLDNRTETDIMVALKFATTDQFWKANIRSGKKFREKFETLITQSKARERGNKKNQFNQFQQRDYDFEQLERELGG